MAQTARVTLTLSNIATTEDLDNMEERLMSQLSDAIAQLRTTVENLALAQSPQKVADLEAAVAAEREKYDALVTAETAEDVTQNQELADAKAATDALMQEMNSAATDLGGITAQLQAVGTAVDTSPDDTPVGEVPVEPAPEPAPAPAPAEPTAETPVEETPVEIPEDTTDTGTAPAPAPAPTGGPVDAAGNPVPPPNL
jgi:hypothetical protein